MKSKKKIVLIMSMLLLLLFLCSRTKKVSAWGPVTHVFYTEEALKRVTGTYITNIIENNKEYFLCGMMYPDVTVIYYYTQWTSYSATHAWEFQRRLWYDACDKGSDQAKAFAIGVGTHLLQDSIVHNYWIPEQIRSTMVQNNIIHPLSEGFLETELINSGEKGIIAEAIASTSFTYWNKPFTDSTAFYDEEKQRNLTPIEWADEILGGLNFIDEASTFNNILMGGAFYQKGYVLPEKGGLWSIYRGVSNIIAPFVSVQSADKYINQTIQITVDWYTTGKGHDPSSYVAQTDPTGYDKLKGADGYVMNFTILLTIIAVVCMLLYYRKTR